MGNGEIIMKKFDFSLSKMRDYKKQLLESEKNKLMKLQAERNFAKEAIKALQVDYDKIHEEMTEKISKGIAIMEIKLFQFRKDSIKLEQQQLQTQVYILDGAIERQRRVVLGLSQEVSGLEKLEEKQREEHERLLAKENELIISEFIASKFIRDKVAI